MCLMNLLNRQSIFISKHKCGEIKAKNWKEVLPVYDFFLSAAITLLVYLLVPGLLCVAIAKKLNARTSKIIAIINSIVGFVIIGVIQFSVGGIPNILPCVIWGTIAYYLMKSAGKREAARINASLHSNDEVISEAEPQSQFFPVPIISPLIVEESTQLQELEENAVIDNPLSSTTLELKALSQTEGSNDISVHKEPHDASEPVNQSDTEPVVKEKIVETTPQRYCQYCGKAIDKLSKRCLGCGRKYLFIK